MNPSRSHSWRALLLLTLLLAAIPTAWRQLASAPPEKRPSYETCAPGDPFVSLLHEVSNASATPREPPQRDSAPVSGVAAEPPPIEAVDGVATGQIRGVVRFRGESPRSSEANLAGKKLPVLQVDPETSGLGQAVVFLVGGDRLPQPPRPAVPAGRPTPVQAVMDQKDHEFTPHIVAITSGGGVRFTNSDVANHNVHGHGLDPKNQFNVFTGGGGSHVQSFRPEKGDRPVRIGCDIHPWMRGWVYVFAHPWFAITNRQGEFQIDEVPPGRHRLVIRQPDTRLEKTIGIEVVAGRVVREEVEFEATDLPAE